MMIQFYYDSWMLFIILHGIMLNYKTSELTKINKYVVRGCSLSEVEYDGKEFKIKYNW